MISGTASALNLASIGRDHSRATGGAVKSNSSPKPSASTSLGQSQISAPGMATSPSSQASQMASPPSSPRQLRLPVSHLRHRSEDTPRSSPGADTLSHGATASNPLQRLQSGESDADASNGVAASRSEPIPPSSAVPPPPVTSLPPPPQHPRTTVPLLWSTVPPAPPLHPSRSERTFPTPSPARRQVQRPTRRRSRSASAQGMAAWSADTSPEISRSRCHSEEQEYFEPVSMLQGRDRRAFTTGHTPYVQALPKQNPVSSMGAPRPTRLSSDPRVPTRRDTERLEQRAMTLPRARSFSNVRAGALQEG